MHKDLTIPSNGINIHAVTEGEGPLVVLLHGFPQFWYAWRHQIPVLATKFKVVAIDLRGYGGTDKPQDVDDYNITTLGNDVVGAIKSLGYEKAHIVGHDWGGALAWEVATYHPEVVDRLVVLNCPHPRLFAKALKSNFRQIGKSWYVFFFQIPKLPEFLFQRWSKNLVDGILRGKAIRKESFSHEDLEKYRLELEKPGAFPAAVNYYKAAFKNRNVKHANKQIHAPTLLIWGESDTALGKELTYGMEPLFSNGIKIHYIPECSHWVQEEKPEEVNQLIMDFLENSY